MAKLEHKMFSLEYALQNRQHWSTFVKECKRMFPELPDTVYCIPQILDLKNNRHFIIDRGNIPVSSLVKQKRDYCSYYTITMIMYFFTVAACISVTLSEDSTFLQSKFPKNHCRRKKYIA